MGFALPGAISAALVEPEKRILAICGDAYGLIEWKQENSFGRHTELSFGNPDWMQLAASFGWNGHQVSKSSELREVLTTALDARALKLCSRAQL